MKLACTDWFEKEILENNHSEKEFMYLVQEYVLLHNDNNRHQLVQITRSIQRKILKIPKQREF